MIGEHSSKQYDQELEAIRSKVLLMGGMVETQFEQALNCFRVGDIAQADKVMADDHAVNQLEVQLDDACSHLIVKRQPGGPATIRANPPISRSAQRSMWSACRRLPLATGRWRRS